MRCARGCRMKHTRRRWRAARIVAPRIVSNRARSVSRRARSFSRRARSFSRRVRRCRQRRHGRRIVAQLGALAAVRAAWRPLWRWRIPVLHRERDSLRHRYNLPGPPLPLQIDRSVLKTAVSLAAPSTPMSKKKVFLQVASRTTIIDRRCCTSQNN